MMKSYLSFFVLAFVLFTCYLSATETEAINAETKSEVVTAHAIPQFKKGDKVYLAITGNVPWMSVYLSEIKKDEFDDPEKYNNNKGVFLIPYDETIDVRIWTQKEDNRDVMRINAKALLDNIAKKISESPKDKTEWHYELNGTSEVDKNFKVDFAFAGIQRFFRLKSITVPKSHKIRQRPRYVDGFPPQFHLFIDIDGILKKDIPTNHKGWFIEFPQETDNQFELREGMNESITLRLKDRNTWVTRLALTEIGNIEFADIQKGTVGETSKKNEEKEIMLKFNEVK